MVDDRPEVFWIRSVVVGSFIFPMGLTPTLMPPSVALPADRWCRKWRGTISPIDWWYMRTQSSYLQRVQGVELCGPRPSLDIFTCSSSSDSSSMSCRLAAFVQRFLCFGQFFGLPPYSDHFRLKKSAQPKWKTINGKSYLKFSTYFSYSYLGVIQSEYDILRQDPSRPSRRVLATRVARRWQTVHSLCLCLVKFSSKEEGIKAVFLSSACWSSCFSLSPSGPNPNLR